MRQRAAAQAQARERARVPAGPRGGVGADAWATPTPTSRRSCSWPARSPRPQRPTPPTPRVTRDALRAGDRRLPALARLEMLEYMELLAVFEASNRRMLPAQVPDHERRGAAGAPGAAAPRVRQPEVTDGILSRDGHERDRRPRPSPAACTRWRWSTDVHERELALIAEFYGDATADGRPELVGAADLQRLGPLDPPRTWPRSCPAGPHRELFVKTAFLLRLGRRQGLERASAATIDGYAGALEVAARRAQAPRGRGEGLPAPPLRLAPQRRRRRGRRQEARALSRSGRSAGRAHRHDLPNPPRRAGCRPARCRRGGDRAAPAPAATRRRFAPRARRPRPRRRSGSGAPARWGCAP